MKKIISIVAILYFSLISVFLLFANDQNKIETSVLKQKEIISTNTIFYIEKDIDKVSNVIFDFNHLKRYITDVEKIELIDSGRNYQIIKYFVSHLFCRYSYAYKREIKNNNHFIIFNLIKENKNNPFIKDSGGFYKIFSKDKKTYVQYYYWIRFQHLLSIFPKKIIAMRTNNYINSLYRYLESI